MTTSCGAICCEANKLRKISLAKGLASTKKTSTAFDNALKLWIATPSTELSTNTSMAAAASNCAVKVKTLPPSSRALTSISPAIKWTKFLAIESPSPLPPNFRFTEASAWLNGEKIMLIFSGEIPMPVSVTSNSQRTVCADCVKGLTRSLTQPVSLNFRALPNKFCKTCPKRKGSPMTHCGTSGCITKYKSIFFCSA